MLPEKVGQFGTEGVATAKVHEFRKAIDLIIIVLVAGEYPGKHQEILQHVWLLKKLV